MKTSRKKWPLLFMAAVILPGLVIGLLAIYFVSQQKQARVLAVDEQLTQRFTRLRDAVQNRAQSAIQQVFQQFPPVAGEIDFSDTNQVMTAVKQVALDNPIVQNPFLIDADGQYLFPFTRQPGSTPQTPPVRQIIDPSDPRFARAEQTEFDKKDYPEAIRRYLDYFKRASKNQSQRIRPYIYNAVARCYFKMKQYPQAVRYYRQILVEGENLSRSDRSLYFLVLRQAGLAYKYMGQQESAMRAYLQLYEEILEDQVSDSSGRFGVLKNEALHYLNRHARGIEEFRRARERDKLEGVSELDISLGWLYFAPPSGTGTAPGSLENQGTRFLRLQELYTVSDEKTAYYSALQKQEQWRSLPRAVSPVLQRLRLSPSGSESSLTVAFQQVRGRGGDEKIFYFGYTVSPSFVREVIIPEVEQEQLEEASLKIFLSDVNRRGLPVLLDTPYRYRLRKLGLGEWFPRRELRLYSNRRDYLENTVEREIRLLYGLMGALMVTLFLGLFILYKYISRESELVRLKSEFVDNVSHTLKTPLTRIALLAENVREGWVTEPGQREEFFNKILSETALMNEMVNNMLDFSRIEAGRKQYRFGECRWQEIVQEVIGRYRVYIQKSGFQLEVEIDNQLPPMPLDREAMELVVVNLLQNAVNYSLEEKYISVRLYREEGYAVLEVGDRGMGISREDLPYIFKKFYRAPDNAVKVRQGSGLGLFILKHAVDAHYGEINVQSEKGSGTVFTIRLSLSER